MPKKEREPQKKSFLKRLRSRFKAYFFTGILVTAPVTITFYMAYRLIMYIDRSINNLLPPKFQLIQYLPYDIPVGFVGFNCRTRVHWYADNRLVW